MTRTPKPKTAEERAEMSAEYVLRKIEKCEKCQLLTRYQRNHLSVEISAALIRFALRPAHKRKTRRK